MKKTTTYILIILVLIFTNLASFAREKQTISKEELGRIQTRTYNINNPQKIMDATIKVLNDQEYTTTELDENLLYVKASKNTSFREVSYLLVTGYVAKTGFDVFQTIITYGLRSYCLVSDVWLIKNEFKDKTSKLVLSISITPLKEQTRVRVNMIDITSGQRDIFLQRLIAGKDNRIRTVHVNDETTYKIFFQRLDKELGIDQKKRVVL